jgi:hypothetical protein
MSRWLSLDIKLLSMKWIILLEGTLLLRIGWDGRNDNFFLYFLLLDWL